MQERQKGSNTRKRADHQQEQTFPETADNLRPPFTKYEVRSTKLSTPNQLQRDLSLVLPTLVTPNRIIWSIFIFTYVYHLSLNRRPVSEFGGATILDPLIPPAKSWQIRVACTTRTSTQPGAHNAAQAHSDPQDTTTRPSPLLAIVLGDFTSSHRALANLRSFVGVL